MDCYLGWSMVGLVFVGIALLFMLVESRRS